MSRVTKTRESLSAFTVRLFLPSTPLSLSQVKPLFSEKIWNDLSTKFYVTFWTLSMYDLKTPSDSYEKERQKLSVQVSTGGGGVREMYLWGVSWICLRK